LTKRILIYCCLVTLSFIPASSQTRGLQLDWVFVSHPLHWKSPPKALHLKEKTVDADLIVLFPDGQFAGVSCYLIKQADGTITISRGDGDVVRIGQWQSRDAEVMVKSQVVFRTVTMIDRAIPEQEVSELLKRSASDRLRTSRWEYRKLQQFSDLEYLDTLIRCDRRSWDGHAERENFVPPCAIAQ